MLSLTGSTCGTVVAGPRSSNASELELFESDVNRSVFAFSVSLEVWHRTFTCVLRAAELVAAVISFSVSVSGLQFPLSLCLCV